VSFPLLESSYSLERTIRFGGLRVL